MIIIKRGIFMVMNIIIEYIMSTTNHKVYDDETMAAERT